MIDHDTSDDMPLEPRLAELARDYNRPPAAPREAMWARIEAARRAERGAVAASVPAATPATVTTRDSVVVSMDAARARRRSARPWALVAAGLAAGLLFGVAVERFRDGDVVNGNGGQPVAVAPVVPPNAAAPGREASPATVPDESLATVAPSATVATRDSGATPRPRAPRTTVPRAVAEASASQALYRAAAVQTLTQAEAVLVAYRAGTLDEADAAQLGRWARDVLSSTRLLLDSPAARDTELRRLLGDLELLLAQLVQLSGTKLTPEERELIDQGIRARDLLPRIRSAVPAGAAASTE